MGHPSDDVVGLKPHVKKLASYCNRASHRNEQQIQQRGKIRFDFGLKLSILKRTTPRFFQITDGAN
jgi:hypothetical protein